MPEKEFHLRDIASPLIRYWWLILLGAAAGAILGFAWSHFKSPLFGSTAVIEAGVDYSRAEAMDAVVQQHALDRVRSLLLSDQTLEGALKLIHETTASPEHPVGLAELRRAIRLSERGASWGLAVTGVDPVLAAEIASAWSESAMSQLETASFHAWRAQELQDVFFQVGCTLESVDAAGVSRATWVCVETEPEIDPDALAQEIQAEANLSKGILPSFSFWVSQEAQVPDRPVARGRGSLVLAGAAIGGCLGLASVAVLGDPSRAKERSKES